MYVFVLATAVTVVVLCISVIKSFALRQWARFEATHPLPAWVLANPRRAYHMACEAHKIATAAKVKTSQPNLASNSFDVVSTRPLSQTHRAINYTFRGAMYTLLTTTDDTLPSEAVDKEHLSLDSNNIIYEVTTTTDSESHPSRLRPFFETIAKCFGPRAVAPNPELLCAHILKTHPDVSTAEVPAVLVKGTAHNFHIDLVLMELEQIKAQ